jgi:hypothetical protein
MGFFRTPHAKAGNEVFDNCLTPSGHSATAKELKDWFANTKSNANNQIATPTVLSVT